MNGVTERGMLSTYAILLSILNHPDILYMQIKNKKLKLLELKKQKKVKSMQKTSKFKEDGWTASYISSKKEDGFISNDHTPSSTNSLTEETLHEELNKLKWTTEAFCYYKENSIENSSKFIFLFQLLKEWYVFIFSILFKILS